MLDTEGICVEINYSAFFFLPRITFVIIPRISAQAIDVIVIFPNDTVSPPIPQIRITATTKRFLLSLRSTSCIILRPDTAMNPYRVTHTPPITQFGIVERKVTNGPKKEIIIAITAVAKMVTTEAFPVIATQPTDSP